MFEYIRLSKKREREKERERFGLISSEERKVKCQEKKNYFARLFLFFSPVSFFTERLKLIYCYLSFKTLLCFLLLLISSQKGGLNTNK